MDHAVVCIVAAFCADDTISITQESLIGLIVIWDGVIFISELICFIDSRGCVLSAVSGLVVPHLVGCLI